ncbi:type I restriction endonuclease [Capilliphycus salinus ALCB114379]|uniref:type I restriction endonuclease n=1 Tax=Capilliphycus salinus TaxID=2768948 RepID=UPI0039A55F2C
MTEVGQPEGATQKRIIELFQNHLGYSYLGDWKHRENNRNIEAQYLTQWLTRQGVNDTLINKTLRELDKAAALGETQNLYDANKAVYRLLRYGVKIKPGAGEQTQTVWLIDWENPENNQYYIAEEVSLKTKSSDNLINTLNQNDPWLICSLIQKFGNHSQDTTNEFIDSLQQLPSNFSPKGNLFVFVDECHRTQSGKLHTAMKQILPNALFIGFTGTPLLKQDKRRSIEVFGEYIHTYKFDEAVTDGIVLDLRYEARDIDQTLTSPQKIDRWFEAKTRGLSEFAKTQLKKK